MFGRIELDRSYRRLYVALCSLAAGALAAGTLVGCGEQVPTAPIRGHVTLSGVPVGPGVVILQPEGAGNGPLKRITTLNFDMHGEFAGRAPLGRHQVIIQSYEGELGQEVDDSIADLPKIPTYYADPAVSQMTALIADGENELRFDLNPAPLQ